MKKLHLLILLVLPILLLTGCETITDEDGSSTTRFDSKAFASGVGTASNAYRDYQNSRREIIAYDAYGNPIYSR